MGALLGLLLPMLPSIIQGVEKLFKKPADPNAKTGPDKLDAVTQMIRQLITAMMQAKVPLPDGTVIPATPITDDTLHAMIETVLAQLKAAGTLDLAPSVGDLYIVRASMFTKLDGIK